MKKVKILPSFILCILFLAASSGNKQTENDPEDRIEDIIELVKDLNEATRNNIPASMLQKAEGLVILPKLIKAGFILGGRHGKGMLVIKDEAGNWSDPGIVKMSGGSIGFQAGVQKIELILVFRDRETARSIGNGEFKIGADAAVTAGPVGREASASTNAKLEAEIYSYSRSKGLFAGISIDGSTLKYDEERTEEFYGVKDAEAEDVFDGGMSTQSELLAKLKQSLKRLSNEKGK